MKTLSVKKEAEAAKVPSVSRATGALRLSVVAAGVLLLCAAVSCKKDEGNNPSPVYNVKTFHATSEVQAGDGKTILDGLSVKWVDGDEAAVQGSDDESPFKYVATGSDGANTDYQCDDVGASGSPFYAIYPFSATSGSCNTSAKTWNVTLPKYWITNESDGVGTFVSGANVMAAKSVSTGLSFKNLCGVLRLKLKGEAGITVKSIQVVSKTQGEKLWGNGLVTFEGGENGRHALSIVNNGDNGVCLVYPNGIAFNGNDKEVECDFVIPGGNLKGGFSLEVYCEYGNGKKGVFFTGATNGGEAMIEQNQITAMSPVLVKVDRIKEGVLPGRFSVGNGKHVHFSQGNLQCNKIRENEEWNDNNISWKFADNQYDVKETVGEIVGDNYVNKSTVTLFGWGTSGFPYKGTGTKEGEASYYQPWNTTGEEGNYGPTDANLLVDDKSDWGWNKISNGGNEEGKWHTLTGGSGGEWGTIFNRSFGAKYAKVQVNGTNGVIIFPDGIPVNNGKTTLGNVEIVSVNNHAALYTTNNINVVDWSVLEAAGVVFLPSALDRFGTKVDNNKAEGRYWSSIRATNSAAQIIHFYTDFINSSSTTLNVYNGCAVRLVRNEN